MNNQVNWVKLEPFPHKSALQLDELRHQRHVVFTPASLKILLKQCEDFFRALGSTENKAQQLALFSEMKASLQNHLTEPLPPPWGEEWAVLKVTEFMVFYDRLRTYCKLPSVEQHSKVPFLSL